MKNIESLNGTVWVEINNNPITESDTTICNQLYLDNKPILEETDICLLKNILITIDDDDTTRGIINCLVNNSPRQIRF